jgi:hypothetical protein
VKRHPILVSWLAVATLAGCSGGSDPEQFAADANAICKKRIDAIEQSVSGDEKRPGTDDEIAGAYEDELADLRDLSPPSEDESSYGKMLDHFEDGSRGARRFAELNGKAEAATNRSDYADLVEQSQDVMVATRRSRTQGNRIATEIGLKACGTALY